MQHNHLKNRFLRDPLKTIIGRTATRKNMAIGWRWCTFEELSGGEFHAILALKSRQENLAKTEESAKMPDCIWRPVSSRVQSCRLEDGRDDRGSPPPAEFRGNMKRRSSPVYNINRAPRCRNVPDCGSGFRYLFNL